MKLMPEQTEKLLTGSQMFTNIAFSMMVTRMKSLYEKNPSQTMLQTCTDEINAFINKFSLIMIEDCKTIERI